MKQFLIMVPLALMLVACSDPLESGDDSSSLDSSDESKIKDIIRDDLNDPKSAQFKNYLLSKDGRLACIVWNAKNEMGGYDDWKTTLLNKVNSEWILISRTDIPMFCTERSFKLFDEAVGILQEVHNISEKEAVTLGIGDCIVEVERYGLHRLVGIAVVKEVIASGSKEYPIQEYVERESNEARDNLIKDCVIK